MQETNLHHGASGARTLGYCSLRVGGAFDRRSRGKGRCSPLPRSAPFILRDHSHHHHRPAAALRPYSPPLCIAAYGRRANISAAATISIARPPSARVSCYPACAHLNLHSSQSSQAQLIHPHNPTHTHHHKNEQITRQCMTTHINEAETQRRPTAPSPSRTLALPHPRHLARRPCV